MNQKPDCMPNRTVLIADPYFIIRKGLKAILEKQEGLTIVGEAKDRKTLFQKVKELSPDIVTLDCNLEGFFTNNDLKTLHRQAPETKVMVVTSRQPRENVVETMESGINSYILKECSKDEIIDAAYAAGDNENFYCGKVLDLVVENKSLPDLDDQGEEQRCEPINLSDREIEIVKLIAQELTNKEIAEHLYISPHTVITHRKNIMKKLDVKNTAGIVMYAVESGLMQVPN
jgi:DNA-binding NarL/FixJ family response regulator